MTENSQLIDDLMAVRMLLMLNGRAVGQLTDDEGQSCLRQTMFNVLRGSRPSAHHIFEDPGLKQYDEQYYADDPYWSDEFVEQQARDALMYFTLFEYLPEDFKERFRGKPLDRAGCCDALAQYNDSHDDQDVLDLINKALADLGAE